MAEDVTEKVIEEAADAVEFIAEEVDQVAETIRSLNQVKIKYAVLGAAVGATAGAVLGFVIAYKRAETKFNKIADEEIAQMREHFNAKEMARENSQGKDQLSEKVQSLGYATAEAATDSRSPLAAVPQEPTVQINNVFNTHSDDDALDWNYATEMRGRTSDKPYIIHKDEHDANEMQLDQTTITYYEEDSVLADERDTILDKKDEVVGIDNLERFGYGSGDPNVLFVRNEKLKMEFEICRSEGSYAKEVHGLDGEDTLEHSDMRRHRSHRHFDDER